jgi:hypothetical protein
MFAGIRRAHDILRRIREHGSAGETGAPKQDRDLARSDIRYEAQSEISPPSGSNDRSSGGKKNFVEIKKDC